MVESSTEVKKMPHLGAALVGQSLADEILGYGPEGYLVGD